MAVVNTRQDGDDRRVGPVALAILAALLYGLSSPLAKLLLAEIPPTLLAALLYLGAGVGMLLVNTIRALSRRERIEAKITSRDAPYITAMIALDIAAPILLLLGLARSTSASAALLNNAEIVATAVIALLVFREAIGRRLWLAIAFITLGSVVLTVEDFRSLSFSTGSLLVLLACVCWGFENNCTRMLSLRDPLQIVVVKGLGSGIGSLLIAMALRESGAELTYLFLALLLGFFAYGLSIFCYIMAQRSLGAARTSAYYAAAPFIGVLLSWVVLREGITGTFVIAMLIMLVGAYFAVTEDHRHLHRHSVETHEHKHSHSDGHHSHPHDPQSAEEHTHLHTHQAAEHAHRHLPDLHHRHTHR
jgi:drug/metabolite transporter (DMT)-like permease